MIFVTSLFYFVFISGIISMVLWRASLLDRSKMFQLALDCQHTTGRWESIFLPEQHNQPTQVLFAAGYDSSQVFKFNPEDGSWKNMSERLPHSMLYSKMAVIGGRIWLVSGMDSKEKFRKEVFNLSVIAIASSEKLFTGVRVSSN